MVAKPRGMDEKQFRNKEQQPLKSRVLVHSSPNTIMGELIAMPINPPGAGTVPSSCAVFLHCIPAPLHVYMTVSEGCTWL